MTRRLLATPSTRNKLVRRVHRWRISRGLSRALAAPVLSDSLGIPVSQKTIEAWETDARHPHPATQRLLDSFLARHGF